MPVLSSLNDNSFQNIDLSSPVNWDHPLNDGLVAWWLALPQWMGGTKWYDLCGRHHGILTNGPTWAGTTRPGGFGSISFDGTDDYANILGLTTGSVWAYAVWAWPTSTTKNQYLCDFSPGNNLALIAGYQNGFYNLFDSGYLTGNPADTQMPMSGGWDRVLWISTGSRLVGCINGRLMVDVAFSAGSTGNNCIVGNSYGLSVNSYSGILDDVRLWFNNPQATSDPSAFAQIDYNLSRQGYPTLLNRTSHLWLRDTIFNEFGSGGIEVVGQSTTTLRYTTAADGGMVANGATVVWKLTSEIAIGKCLCSGTTEGVMFSEQVARGRVACSVVAASKAVFSINSVGGVQVCGQAGVELVTVSVVGTEISGEAIVTTNVNQWSVGGAKISTHASVELMTASAVGAEISGEAFVTTNVNEWSTGGTKIGGSSFEEVGCVAPLCEAGCGYLGESKANVEVKIGKAVIPAVTACQMGKVPLKHIEQRYTKQKVFVPKEKFPF